MKRTILQIFFGSFALLFILGVIHGYQARNSGERREKQREVLYANLRHLHYKGHYFLVYRCEDKEKLSAEKQLFTYNVDANGLENAADLAFLKDADQPLISLDRETAKDFIIPAAAASGYSLRDALRYFRGEGFGAVVTKSARFKQFAALAAGALSGYYFGYWLARPGEARCEDDWIKSQLRDSATWRSIEKPYWLSVYPNAARLANSVGKDRLDLAKGRIETALDLTSADFDALSPEQLNPPLPATTPTPNQLYAPGGLLERLRERLGKPTPTPFYIDPRLLRSLPSTSPTPAAKGPPYVFPPIITPSPTP